MTTPVAQRPDVDQRSAHEAGEREAAPQEQPVSNGVVPTAGKVGRGRDRMPRGCHECAWGKVAGCWRCGSR